VTDGSTNVVTSATAKFLKNHTRVGDRLCIEYGPNRGEYFIDTLENKGLVASVSAPASGISTITGLANMSASSVGGVLELLDGTNKGHYKILSFISASSVTIRHPGALLAFSVPWRERPQPPYMTDSSIALKDINGAPVVLPVYGPVQIFRVIRPFLHRAVVFMTRQIFHTPFGDAILEATYTSEYGIGTNPRRSGETSSLPVWWG
jgi:hypothetical protein